MRTFLLSLAAMFLAVSAMAQVPSVKVENSKGEAFDTAQLLDEGTPMIISFWSTTCKPCIRELEAVYESLPDWLDEVDFRVGQQGIEPAHKEGMNGSNWYILDYSDVIVHVFYQEMRSFYRLEQLWADAPATRYESEE